MKVGTRARLLDRLRSMGCQITPVLVDEFSQMTVAECRAHVRACELVVNRVPRSMKQALSEGWAVVDGQWEMSRRETRCIGEVKLQRRMGDEILQTLVAGVVGTFRYAAPRQVKR